MDGESSSFFERHPWRAAAVFFAMIAGVGIFIVMTVGERPHYRNAEWQFVTERPNQGKFMEGLPYAMERVFVQVLVRVDRADGKPGFGFTAELMNRETLEVFCGGMTGLPGGHVFLPVPSELDAVLFRGGIDAILRVPGEAPRIAKVEPPERGRSNVTFELKP